jgi:hypothetical protein
MGSVDSYSLFKPIRNKLGEHDITSLVINATKKLHEIENKTPADFRGWSPWLLLLLIKWSYEFGGQKYPSKSVDESKLAKIITLIKNFEESFQTSFLDEAKIYSVPKFLRILAFQQFWFQSGFGTWHITRSLVLFCSLPSDHPIQKAFFKVMSISMLDFLELGFLVWVWLKKGKSRIKFDPDYIFSLSTYDPKTIEAFLHGISLLIDEVNDYLRNRPQAIKNISLQPNETTPFVRYPLLKLGNEYLVYSRRVYEVTLGNIFYDIMKREGGSSLSEQFASELEKYVKNAFLQVKLKFYSEVELKYHLKGEKVTDFLLPFDDCTVLLEIKSCEMRPSVKVNPKTQQLINELQDSVIKGTIQGISLVNTLKQSKDGLVIPNRDKFFLLIVTYRELFLGHGRSAWDEFLREAVIKELANTQIDINAILPDHIITLNIEEFDLLIAALNNKNITLPEILNRVVKNNADVHTMKLSFIQHLAPELHQGLKLPYLDDPLQKLWENFDQKLK